MANIKQVLKNNKILLGLSFCIFIIISLRITKYALLRQAEFDSKEYLIDFQFLSNTIHLFREIEENWLKYPDFIVNKKKRIANCFDENMEHSKGDIILAFYLEDLSFWKFKHFTDNAQEQIHHMLDSLLMDEVLIDDISFFISIKTSSVLKADEVYLWVNVPGKNIEPVLIIKEYLK